MKKFVAYSTYYHDTCKEIIELKIRMLEKYVDKFVICESNKTQSGISIPYQFKNWVKEIGLPEEKIQVIEYNMAEDEDLVPNELDYANCPDGNDKNINALRSRIRERIQRDALKDVLDQFDDDTFFIMADCDEIIMPESLEFISNFVEQNPNSIIKLPLVYLECRGDLRIHDPITMEPNPWKGAAYICKKHHLVATNPCNIRSNTFSPFPVCYLHQDGKEIDSFGWHFSWMGDAAVRKKKQKAFMHYQDKADHAIFKDFNCEETERYAERAPQEGMPSPSGFSWILRKYPISNLPKEVFEIPRVYNYLFPHLTLEYALRMRAIGL